MAQMPDFKIKGRLAFRPEAGDVEHDLGEVEFALTPQPPRPMMRRDRFASGEVILPTGPTAGATVSPAPAPRVIGGEHIIPRQVIREMTGDHAHASRGLTVAMYNGEE